MKKIFVYPGFGYRGISYKFFKRYEFKKGVKLGLIKEPKRKLSLKKIIRLLYRKNIKDMFYLNPAQQKAFNNAK